MVKLGGRKFDSVIRTNEGHIRRSQTQVAQKAENRSRPGSMSDSCDHHIFAGFDWVKHMTKP